MSAVYVGGKFVNARRIHVSERKRVLTGFDYRVRREVERSRSEWRDELRGVISRGGRRRFESGETFGHAKGGLIEFEIYDNVNI